MYSVLSGIFASLASISGKFAMGYDDALWLCEVFTTTLTEMIGSSKLPCQQYVAYTRILFFILMLLINVIMWTTFVKALRYSRTSVEATLTNTATNFLFTAIFSQVFFGEFITLMWWIGTLLIIFGLLVIHQGNQQAVSTTSKKRKRK